MQPESKNKKIEYEEAEEAREYEMEDEFGVEDQRIKGDDLEEYEDQDYRDLGHLDQYDSKELDDREYEPMSLGQKRRAEEEIKRREQYKGNYKNVPDLLKSELDSNNISHVRYQPESRRKLYEHNLDYYDDDGDQLNDERYQVLDDIRGKLPEWINEERTVRYIKRSFYRFLNEFNENGVLIYQEKIRKMCSENKQSIEINYNQLTNVFPTLAYWIFESPSKIFGHLNQVLLDIACKFYPGYESIYEEMFVKIDDFPLIEKIRDLRTFHLNTLVKVKGVITKKYPTYQKLQKFYYVCVNCTDKKGPIYVNEEENLTFSECNNCQSKGPYKKAEEERVYGNNQKVIIQESPQSVPPGRVPRQKEVILLGDNIDKAKPGDEVEIVGIYTSIFDIKMNQKHCFPIFKTFIEGNNIREMKQIESTELSEADKKEIHKASKNPEIFRKIFNSIAPSIYGHDLIKKSIALALFGGCPIQKESHTIRGDINILLLGDPGLGKSQFLKYIQHVSHRSIYTTGKGASAVGLTASVKKDPVSQEWCLEGGALVLADSGICMIDEFDKMNDADRTSIHEAMEQQSISISKAGIVATLKARCSVIAAANPVKGNYDDKLSFKDNVQLSDPILSRFDILLVLKDEANLIHDQKLADFIIDSHINNHPNDLEEEEGMEIEKQEEVRTDIFEQKFLKKYILYAKKYYNEPRMDEKCSQKLKDFYVKLRQESKKNSGLNIVVRHLESLIRMAQSSAKIHLRKIISLKDCDIAINILLNSFIQSQKPSVGLQLEQKFKEYLKKNTSQFVKLTQILNELMNQKIMYDQIQQSNLENVKEVKIRKDDFHKKAEEMQIRDLGKFYSTQYFQDNFFIIREMSNDQEVEYILKEI